MCEQRGPQSLRSIEPSISLFTLRAFERIIGHAVNRRKRTLPPDSCIA